MPTSAQSSRGPLAEAPSADEMFQKKEDGAIKVVLKP
jgi:threonine dehydrogenase-like Zn-dependent dehydrogenase